MAHCTVARREDGVLVVTIHRLENEVPFFREPPLWARPFKKVQQDAPGDAT